MPLGRHRGEAAKSRYYVWYLGWKESRGLAGREFTEPIVKDLVIRRKGEQPIKLTLELSASELKIYQVTKGKFGRTEKVRFPTIPTEDVTYAVQGLDPDDDVVACVYLGYNPTTRRTVHVHVYRFDSPSTARTFCEQLTDVIRRPEHERRVRQIEAELTSRGEIAPRPRGFVRSYELTSTATSTPSTVTTDSAASDSDDVPDRPRIEPDERVRNVAAELRWRLGNPDKAPILLPPQDYDTVRRVRGNLTDRSEYEARKCRNLDIVGPVAASERDPEDSDSVPNGGGASGSEFRSPSSDAADVRRHDRRREDAGGEPTTFYGPDPADPERPAFGRSLSNAAEPTSPDPDPYGDGHYLAPVQSPHLAPAHSPHLAPAHSPHLAPAHSPHLAPAGSPPAGRNQAKDARPRRDAYPDEGQYVMAFPAGTFPPPGVVAPSGVIAAPSSLPHGAVERIPRQLSTGSSSLSDPYSSALPKQHLPRAEDGKKKKKKQKGKEKEEKRNKNRVEEPPPDYTLHPSNVRRIGALYA